MPEGPVAADDFFKAEFGTGELCRRLWQGGLRASPEGYSLAADICTLTRSLTDGLDARFEGDDTVELMISDLETCWDDIARLRRACQPLIGHRTDHLSPLATSLVQHLLSIELFQPPLITTLVNKLSELSSESSPHTQFFPVLLNQLRWLHFLVDGPALCEALLSIIPIMPEPMQKHVIESLPEILDDQSKHVAVAELIKLIEQLPSLMGSVIDAISMLGVPMDRLPEVNTSILSTLAAVNRDVLPISIKYLLTNCPAVLYTQTISALRNVLALPALGPASAKLSFEAVRYSFRSAKPVADHAIKVLRGLQNPADHRPSDVWLMLALYDSPAHHNQVKSLFRRKAAAGVITRPLLDAALAPFASAFAHLSKPLAALAAVAVKAPDANARHAGIFIYALLFRIFSDGDVRMNVVSALINHVGTRRPGEVETALDSMILIASEGEEDRSLLPYSASVQRLLDSLEFFSDSQLRRLWTVMGHLCLASAKKMTLSQKKENGDVQGGQGDSSDTLVGGELQSLEILLEKELTHADTFYRRIGVIGSCTMVKVLGSLVENNILKMLLDVGKSNPLSQAMAYDELAEVFSCGSVSETTAENIRQTISARFESKYLRDCSEIGSMVKNEKLLPAEFFGNLEGEDCELCFSIAALIRNEETLEQARDSVRCMVPNLRLLCVLTSIRFNGSLAEVDAIIGAPLHIPLFPKEKDMDDVSQEGKNDLLLSLFIAHGWIVELVNGFARQESNELRAKCVNRIDTLLDISSQIGQLVPHVPRWRQVLYDSYNGTTHSIVLNRHEGQGLAGSNTTGKKRKGGKDKALNSGGKVESNDEWKQLSRHLSSAALSLIRIRNPITFRHTETEEVLREGEPVLHSITLSRKGLRYLLTELVERTEIIVGGQDQRANVFIMALYPQSVSGKGDNNTSRNVGIGGKLEQLKSLREALEAVSAQLRRCFDSLLSDAMQDEAEDEVDKGVNRECVMLCLHSLAITLNSTTVRDLAARDMLFYILASIRLDGKLPIESSDPMTEEDVHVAAKTGFDQLYNQMNVILTDESGEHCGAHILEFEGCCAMLATMDALMLHCSEGQQKKIGPKLSGLAYAIISLGWEESVLRVRKTQKLIPGLVRLYVQYSSVPLKVASGLREKITLFSERLADTRNRDITDTQAALVRGGGSQAGGIGSLKEQTLYAFTIAILDQYVWLFKRFKPSDYDKTEDALAMMETLLRSELPLYTLARSNQRILGPVMRTGRTLVELFMKICLPFLKQKFSDFSAQVVQICRIHQKPTRLLQTFCAHSKAIRDTSLTGLVPPLRKSLELLLYRVKEILQAHNAMGAFQMGNLKHRDIHGEIVGSQDLAYNNDNANENSDENHDGNDGDNDGDDGGEEEEKRAEEEGVPVIKEDLPIIMTEEDADEENEENGATHETGRDGEIAPPEPSPKKRRLTRGKSARRGGRGRKVVVEDDEEDEEMVDDLLREDVPLGAIIRTGSRRDDAINRPEESRERRGKKNSRAGSAGTKRSSTSASRIRNIEYTQRVRCPLVDDEAGDDDDEEEEYWREEEDLASQFVLDDDEEIE